MSELLFMDIFGIGRLKAKKMFPEAAEKMGLKAHSLLKKRSFPQYSGSFSNFKIEVAPEMSSIKVMMQSVPGLFMNTFGKNVEFDIGNETIDRFFTERKAPRSTYEKLVGNAEWVHFVRRFIEKWKRVIQVLDVEPGYIECRMKYGNGHYIPASVLEPMTSDLVKIADILQKTVNIESSGPANVKE
ncbi:MAG: hypothetical protein HGJ94_19635 [Desulfosarcina sp.]|nr:hypothetical protein [Desulfosarcina sp.]MBC2741659.1 hypothetical protein [Desulfosarcina sp.]MBC2764573.1 hypothetical protein [Desulfosarcina sp.]